MTDDRELIGILGGSFNPVHAAHMMLANYLVEFTPLSKVWLTLSPRNPMKSRPNELISDLSRLEMLKIATAGAKNIQVCDIELSMPRPSYTVDTLRLLTRRYPRKRFKLIIGSDNWRIFDQWKNAQEILDNWGVIVYPRPGHPMPRLYETGLDTVDAPLSGLSSTFVRDAISHGRNMNYFLPPGVYNYIKANRLYLPKNDTK